MIARFLILLSGLLLSGMSFAEVFVLSNDWQNLPNCSSNQWATGGDVYHCVNGKVTLNSNDSIRANNSSTLKADDGFRFSGRNTVGTSSASINLESRYGSFDWYASNNQLFGEYTGNNSVSLRDVTISGGIDTGGMVTLQDSQIGGGVRSENNKISINNSEVNGDVYANGDIVVEESSYVNGNITTPNNKVTIKDSEVSGNISANKDITIEGSSVTGDINTPNNGVIISDSDIYGDVSANGDVNVDNSEVIGNLTSSNNKVILNDNTHVVGDVTAGKPNWGTVIVNGGSTVDGTCLYQTSPANACGVTPLPNPVAWYQLEESSWSGAWNEVTDISGNNLHGQARNGALTATSNPALPAINSMGTCGYGYFEHDSNQFVEVSDSNLLDLNKTLTVSAWVYPTSRPNSDLFTIFSKDANYEVHIRPDGHIFWWWQEKQNSTTRTLTSSAAIPLNDWSFVSIRYDVKKSSATLFVNGEVQAQRSSNRNRQLVTNNNPFQIAQDQDFPGRAFDGAIDEVQVFDRALTDQQIGQLYRQRHQCSSSPTLQCFSDDYSSGQLSDLWVVSTSKGNFQPSVQNGRLRFTQAVGNQATSSTYQRLFPAKDNLVEIEFDHFAYGGSGADGIAVVLSDALVTPRAGAFGGPLGYGFKRNEPGFAGGWLGVGLDEFGNFSNEGGQGWEPGRRRQSVALRGSGVNETGYRYLAGACGNGQTNPNGNCLSPTVDGNNSGATHRYKIVVDSRIANESQVEISRKIGSGNWQPIVGPINVLDAQYSQSSVPEDFLLSITGSTGGSTNIHEIDNFKVCALDSRPIDEQIDHFRISHTGQALTCNKESVTIKACLNSTCSELYTGTVTATLSPANVSGGGGWIGGNVVTFSGGSGSFDLRKNQPGTLTLDVSGSTPTAKPFSTNLCNTGNGWSSNNCNITFYESGFVVDVPDKIANQSVTATIKAVKQSDSSQQCVPSFANVSKNVDFWSTYFDPISSDIVGDPRVSIDDTQIGNNPSSATNLALSFNASGEASFDLNYPDAGMLQLNARYSGSGQEQGLSMTGVDNFVSFPKYLTVAARNVRGESGSCNSADISCAVFSAAGEKFDLEVTAYGADDVVTPNYKHSGIEITHSLVAPSGGEEGVLSIEKYSQVPIVGGTNSVEQTISEVGVFQFTLTPPLSFNGSTAFVISSVSTGNIGRFTPAYFNLTPLTPKLQATCDENDDFTYLGQPFDYRSNPGAILNPVDASGNATKNYLIGNWWRYSNQWDERTYTASNGIDITFDPDDTSSVNRTLATASNIELVDEELIYEKPSGAIEPFKASFDLALTATDLTDSDGVCYRTSGAGPCLGHIFEDIDGELALHWGRLVIHDTYGSELTPLRQKLEVQHYVSGSFRTNTEDSCTSFGTINRFSFASDEYNVVTSTPSSSTEIQATLLAPATDEGESWLEFGAPGAGNTGAVITSFDMETHGVPWLRSDENKDGDFENVASGVVQFGLYRGSDRVIWWSERN